MTSNVKAVMILLQITAKKVGVATWNYGIVKAERTQSGRIMWFINGNRCSRKDAFNRILKD